MASPPLRPTRDGALAEVPVARCGLKVPWLSGCVSKSGAGGPVRGMPIRRIRRQRGRAIRLDPGSIWSGHSSLGTGFEDELDTAFSDSREAALRMWRGPLEVSARNPLVEAPGEICKLAAYGRIPNIASINWNNSFCWQQVWCTCHTFSNV